MLSCKPVATPVDTKGKLGSSGPEFEDPSLYRSLAGALQYLTFTRLDISYAVQQVCMYMHSPRLSHWDSLKRIIRYLHGTSDIGLTLGPVASPTLRAYTDADWVGCPDTRRSTSGYCVYLGDNLISWSSKRQTTISRSSAEAEYRGIANVVADICWIRNLLLELHRPLTRASLVYCDYISSIIFREIQFNTNEQSTSSLISTLFVSRYTAVWFVFYTSPLDIKWQTFLLKDYRRHTI